MCSRSTFGGSSLSFLGLSHVGSLFTSEEQKEVCSRCNRQVCSTYRPTMHSCCHRRRLPGTNWQHSWLCLCVFLMWIFFFLRSYTVNWQKKDCWGLSLTPCLSKEPVTLFLALIALYVRLETQYCEKAYDDLHIYMCNQYISNVFISIFVLYLDISVRKKWFWWSQSLRRKEVSVCVSDISSYIDLFGGGGGG